MQVLTAFAFALVLIGLISAGYNQGRGSHVLPNEAMKRNRPTAAPLALLGVSTIRQENVISIDRLCPTVPHKKSLRRPARSMMNQETVAKIA